MTDAKDSTPRPFVFKNCPDDPSEVGKVKPLIVTPPVPFPESSKFEFDAFADTVLSVIVTPSIVIEVLAVSVVNVPAAGVEPPIVVPSIVPPSMSRSFGMTTVPVPDAFKIKFELDAVV